MTNKVMISYPGSGMPTVIVNGERLRDVTRTELDWSAAAGRMLTIYHGELFPPGQGTLRFAEGVGDEIVVGVEFANDAEHDESKRSRGGMEPKSVEDRMRRLGGMGVHDELSDCAKGGVVKASGFYPPKDNDEFFVLGATGRALTRDRQAYTSTYKVEKYFEERQDDRVKQTVDRTMRIALGAATRQAILLAMVTIRRPAPTALGVALNDAHEDDVVEVEMSGPWTSAFRAERDVSAGQLVYAFSSKGVGPMPDEDAEITVSPSAVAVDDDAGKTRFELPDGLGFSDGDVVEVDVGGKTYKSRVERIDGKQCVDVSDSSLCKTLASVGGDALTASAPPCPSAPPEDDSCGECFGTGRWNGFGGPCSKGCPQVK